MDIRSISTFWLLGMILLGKSMYQCSCGQMVLFMYPYLGVGLLGQMVTLCHTFWGTSKLLCKVTALLFIPISNEGGFQFLLILTILVILSFLMTAILVCMKQHPIVWLYSPMTSDGKYPFMCLLNICISSCEKCLFQMSMRNVCSIRCQFLNCSFCFPIADL